ncbi:MAG: type II secretion system F family protein [Puniceicoccales bacterium]|nr:type II secretion system F family protein [Puniceicoccales bacterium]
MEPLRTFSFWGRKKGGGYESGEISARNLAAARQVLSDRDISVEFLMERPIPSWRRTWQKVKNSFRGGGGEWVLHFTRQLSTLLRAGIPLVDAIELLLEQTVEASRRSLLEAILRDLRLGHYLHEALELHPQFFDETYGQLVRAGELSGNLPAILEAISASRGRSLRHRNRAISALIYPLVVFFVAVVALFFLSLKILPQFQLLFRGEGQTIHLPYLTHVLGKLFATVHRHCLLLTLLLLLLSFITAGWAHTERGRIRLASFALRLPLFGQLILWQQLILFLRVFSLAFGNAVPFPETLQLSCKSVANKSLRALLAGVAARAQEGVFLGELLAGYKKIPASVRGLIAVGERSGRLASMAALAADSLEEDLENKIQRLAAILQPAITIALAGMVAAVAMVLFLPLTQALQLRAL